MPITFKTSHIVGAGLLALLLVASGAAVRGQSAAAKSSQDKASAKSDSRGASRIIGKYLPVVSGEPDCFALRRPQGGDEWQRLERNKQEVSTRDTLVGLPGYRSEVQLASGVRLKLWGELPEFGIPEAKGVIPLPILESVVVIHDPGAFDLDLTLDRGRIVLANYKMGQPARIRVRLENSSRGGELSWEITLPRRGSEVALERWSRYPPGVAFSQAQDRTGPESEVYLFALKGPARLKTGSTVKAVQPPPGRAMIAWNSKRGIVAGPIPIKKLPQWALYRYPPFPKGVSKEEENYLKRVRTATVRALHEFSVRMLGKEFAAGLAATLKSNNVTVRLLSVRSLAATDDLSGLLECLDARKAPGLRQAAVMSLRHWIALHAANDLILHEMLIKEKGYTPREAGTLLQLLHSFSARDRAQPATYARLIGYLRQTKISIRQLAHWHLALLVPQGLTIKYDPAGDTAQLYRGYTEWKKLVPEGKLPPPPKKSAKP